MPLELTKLKEVPQGIWLDGKFGYSKDGICYYMSEYVRQTIWGSKTVKSFEAGVTAAKKAVPATIMKAGKAKNLHDKSGMAHGKAQATYADVPANLAANKLYRVALWFGATAQAPPSAASQNHEAVVLTGAADEVLLFEPNFGFYKAVETGSTLKDVFQAGVGQLYQPDEHAEIFRYLLDRSVP